MKRELLILLSFTFLFVSCINDVKDNESTKNVVTSFSITSKNPELTSKNGTNISIDQMITKNIISGNKLLFKDVMFTLDHKLVENALNFSSKDGKLICNAPTELSVMSMPPTGNGATIYSKGDNFQLSGISLIKINGVNFVISDIKLALK